MESQQSQSPQPTSPGPAWPKVLILLIVLIALAYGALYWIKSKMPIDPYFDTILPTPSTSDVDMTGWQTYRNDEYGFEFMYPDAWEFGGEGLNNGIPTLGFSSMKFSATLQVSMLSDDQLDEIVKGFSLKNNVFIDGQSAQEFVPDFLDQVIFYIPSKRLAIIFFDTGKYDYQQILSTFKLTK